MHAPIFGHAGKAAAGFKRKGAYARHMQAFGDDMARTRQGRADSLGIAYMLYECRDGRIIRRSKINFNGLCRLNRMSQAISDHNRQSLTRKAHPIVAQEGLWAIKTAPLILWQRILRQGGNPFRQKICTCQNKRNAGHRTCDRCIHMRNTRRGSICPYKNRVQRIRWKNICYKPPLPSQEPWVLQPVSRCAGQGQG
jgi:hypothetical protein